MAEINKMIVLVLELLIAIGAILFLAGLFIGIFGWSFPITSEIGIISGSALILICGFALALYYTREEKTPAAN